MPHFSTKQDFINYLSHTLIPDLIESGSTETAKDFLEAIHWMQEDEE